MTISEPRMVITRNLISARGAEAVFGRAKEGYELVESLSSFVTAALRMLLPERGKQQSVAEAWRLLNMLRMFIGGDLAVTIQDISKDEFGKTVVEAAQTEACKLRRLAEDDKRALELHQIQLGATRTDYIWYSAVFDINGQNVWLLQAEHYLFMLSQNVAQAAEVVATVAQTICDYLWACAAGRSADLKAVYHAETEMKETRWWAQLNYGDVRSAVQEVVGFPRILAIVTEPTLLAASS